MKLSTTTLGLQSLFLYLENELLEVGLYENISSGTVDYNGIKLGLFTKSDNEQDISAGHVYRAPFNNLVYESGFNIPSGYPAPILASGIYVNGSFKARNDSVYSHSIDYPEGRIIFNNFQSGELTVHSDYCRKMFTVSAAYPDKVLMLDKDPYNRDLFGKITYPSGSLILPAILIKYNGENRDAFQLGGGQIVRLHIILNVIAFNEYDCSNIVSLIGDKEESSFGVIDFNIAPFPLNERGDYSVNYNNYGQLVANYAKYNAVIANISSRASMAGYPRHIVNLDVDIYKI